MKLPNTRYSMQNISETSKASRFLSNLGQDETSDSDQTRTPSNPPKTGSASSLETPWLQRQARTNLEAFDTSVIAYRLNPTSWISGRGENVRAVGEPLESEEISRWSRPQADPIGRKQSKESRADLRRLMLENEACRTASRALLESQLRLK